MYIYIYIFIYIYIYIYNIMILRITMMCALYMHRCGLLRNQISELRGDEGIWLMRIVSFLLVSTILLHFKSVCAIPDDST